MSPLLRRALLLCTLPALLAATPRREEDMAPGFADIAIAAAGTFVASGDGTVRRVDGDTLPVAVDAHHKLVGLAVSEDGQQVAAVGAGVVARSSDGGKTFRVEPTPDGVMVYAAAFSGGDLLLFDVKGRGFRAAKGGKGFEPLKLPREARFWTASFAGPRGYVVGQGGVLLGTLDGGKTWKELPSPTEAEGVLAMDTAVWVGGKKGVFRSDDAGRTFRQVFGAPEGQQEQDCVRLGGRGKAVVVACHPWDHALAYAADGEHFQEVRVPDAAHLLSAAIAPDGALLAVGTWELFVRARPSGGKVVVHSEQTRIWLKVVDMRRANEERVRLARAQPKPPPPAKPPESPYPVREGEPTVLTGTVRDEHGEPVAGVPVDMVGSWAIHGEGYQRTETDARGRFRFKPSKVGSARLSLKARGYAPERRVVPLSEKGETVVDLALRPEVPLAGTVASSEGPVSKGYVTLWPLPPEGADLVKWRGHTVRVSGADLEAGGAFHLAEVPAGDYLLEVQAQGFQPTSLRVRTPDAFVRVRVGEGGHVTGRLLSAQGAPVQGSQVELRPGPETQRALAQAGVDLRNTVSTDAQGRFTVGGVPDGDYALEVSTGYQGPKHECLRREVSVRGGEALPVELRLGQGPVISGRVTDAHGRPLRGADVLGTGPGDLCGWRRAHTGADGTFILKDVHTSAPYKLEAFIERPGGSNDELRAETQASAGDRDVKLVVPDAP